MFPNRLCIIGVLAGLFASLPLRGQNSVAVSCPSQAAAAGVAACQLSLSLVSGVTVDSLTVGVAVTPNGAAPALTQGQLSFSDAIGSGFSSTGGTSYAISVVWFNLGSPLSGTVPLGSVSFGLPAAAALGQTYTVTITGASASLANNAVSLAVGGPANITIANLPTIVSVTPNAGLPGQTLGSVTITGRITNFAPGSTMAGFGVGITVNSVTVISPTSAILSLTITGNAAVGARDATLTTGGEVATLAGGFTVSSFSPCDVGDRGATGVADVQQMINEVLGAGLGANDLNGDGVVNVVDVQMVIGAALGHECFAG